MAYRIEYDPDTHEHLQALTARQRAIVLDRVDEQLTHEPTVETRNRKRMRPTPLAPWELRAANLRVYYDVQDEPELIVTVRAVGTKVRHQLRIAGKVFEL